MATAKTSISAGDVIYGLLSSDTAVSAAVTAIYPVMELIEAKRPYIVYRRTGMTVNPQKAGQPGADTVEMEVLCYTADYEEGLELAEMVREAMDYRQHEESGLRMRSCYLSDSSEFIEGEAFVQKLVFLMKL